MTNVDGQPVLPLLGHALPIPGESWMSLLARSAEANVFERLREVLAFAGVEGAVPAHTPFTVLEHAPQLAQLLSIDPSDVRGRMHKPLAGVGAQPVEWFGASLERRFIEARARRVSPASLRLSPHHRATWSVRPLSFCPESTELLISRCPTCRRDLGWVRTLGIGRCEYCRSSLLEHDPGRLADELVEEARLAARLVSASEGDRRAALGAFPEPFASWEAGAVFEAVVEMGSAWAFADRDEPPPALENGAGLSAEHLVRGVRALMNWSADLPPLVRRLWEVSMPSGAVSTIPAWVGPLGRLLRSTAAHTPLRQKLLEDLPFAIAGASLPVKASTLGPAAAERRRSEISQKDAEDLFGLCRKTIRKLDHGGRALVVRREGLTKLYDLNALTQSVEAYRNSVSSRTCAAQLGVPEYCLTALAAAGLLEAVTDHDALLLGEGGGRFSKESLAALRASLGGEAARREADTSLSDALFAVLAPAAWAAVLSAVLGGEIDARLIRSVAAPHINSLYVDASDIDPLLAAVDLSVFPPDASVSSLTAGRLFGVKDVIICKAIADGLLPARSTSQRHEIPLWAFANFAKSYVLTAELRRRSGLPRKIIGDSFAAAGVRPVATLKTFSVWARPEAERVLGLPPLRAIVALAETATSAVQLAA